MPRSVQDILDHADELAKRFEDYEPSSDDERDPEVFSALRAAVVSRSEAERAVKDAVVLARLRGYSWAFVGSLIGTSGEAARQRYGRTDSAIAGESGKKASKNDRLVVPSPQGGWIVKKPGARRASTHHSTKAQAVDRAREIVRNAGGGEVIVHGRDGQIRDSATVHPGKDSDRATVGQRRPALDQELRRA